MKITAFDALYPNRLGGGDTILVSSSGSNSGYSGGDVLGEPGDLSVVGLRSTVALSSNLSTGAAIGDVLSIIQTAGSVVARFSTPSNYAYASNSARVSAGASAGASTSVSRADHIHDGIGTVTASSSNTMGRGTLNLRAGTNISFGLTDGDGDGAFDTVTINGSGAGGGGGSSLAAAVSVQKTGTDYTTTSTSFGDIDATNLSHTITTGAHRVKVTLAGGMQNSANTNTVVFDIHQDGVSQGTANGTWQFRPNSNGITTPTFTWISDVLSAGSHTFKLQWKVNGNTGTLYRNAFYPLVFAVEEMSV